MLKAAPQFLLVLQGEGNHLQKVVPLRVLHHHLPRLQFGVVHGLALLYVGHHPLVFVLVFIMKGFTW